MTVHRFLWLTWPWQRARRTPTRPGPLVGRLLDPQRQAMDGNQRTKGCE